MCGIQLYFLSISENKSAFPLGSSSHIQSTPNSNMPGEEAPTTPIILCCPYYKKSAFYNISTVVSIENLALTLPLAGPVAFPSSAAVSIPHPLQTVIKSRTSQKGVFRISGTLVKATPPKKNVGWIFAVPLTSK